MTRRVVGSIEAEFRRYKALGEGAIGQLSDRQLCGAPREGDNSVAVVVWHVSGNLKSRFTDFLTSDGEKPWRERDSEFLARSVSREEALGRWEEGWAVVLAALEGLADDQLDETVTIRQVPHSVLEALLRSLGHTSYHVGQIVYQAKSLLGKEWRYLSIPPGGSAAYNRNPTREKHRAG